MTRQEQQEQWKKIKEHSAYLPWWNWQTDWSVVGAGSRGALKKAQWCCENIQGFFSIRNTSDRTSGKVFFFDKEEDAVAFKLRWI